ncbi:MAG: hypothetical protein HYS70_02175 [Nitrospinae bacterium]|nr:hypothetical protein [Nitrospinota bacterium]
MAGWIRRLAPSGVRELSPGSFGRRNRKEESGGGELYETALCRARLQGREVVAPELQVRGELRGVPPGEEGRRSAYQEEPDGKPGERGKGQTEANRVLGQRLHFGIFEKRGHQEIYQPGGVYFFLPIVNSWNRLPISQQNLLMTANSKEGDRPVPDDVTFKTKDGNNVHIDVNVMWQIDPKKAGKIVSNVGTSIDEIKERLVRPISR